MRGATAFALQVAMEIAISTHTPHAGRDTTIVKEEHMKEEISTHTPHAGRDNIRNWQ